MDQHRFDQLTRSLAAGGSRRRLLKGFAAAVGGALGLRAATPTDARTRAPNGTPCASPRDCASGLCVDGICCDGACVGTCEACNVAGLEGTCAPVFGAPVGNRGPCSGGGICGGICDGVEPGYCAGYAGPETSCGPATCANGWETSQVCSGNGSCISSTSSCGLFACLPDGSGCATTCTTDADCVGEAHCTGGVCQGDLTLGASCSSDDQCQSGHCADGVCCDSACGGVCQVCGGDGYCVDDADGVTCDGGVCCNGSCTALGTDANCSACGDRCGSNASCCEGSCTELGTDDNCAGCGDVCVNGEACCDGACTELGTELNCAGCDDACIGDTACCDGACTALGTDDNCETCGDACATGEACCDQGCTPLGTDDNCAACGDVCVNGEVCCEGSCLLLGTDDNCSACGDVCVNGETCCDGSCTALGTDQHCAGCGDVCVNGETCCSGACTLIGTGDNCASCGDICVNGESCCEGTCTQLGTEANCAACGDACVGDETCESGICQEICLELLAVCESEEQCCGDGITCAPIGDVSIHQCCVGFGQPGCSGTSSDECCLYLLEGGANGRRVFCGGGICGGQGAICGANEACASGECCIGSSPDGICCGYSQQCIDGQCVEQCGGQQMNIIVSGYLYLGPDAFFPIVTVTGLTPNGELEIFDSSGGGREFYFADETGTWTGSPPSGPACPSDNYYIVVDDEQTGCRAITPITYPWPC